MNEYKVRTVILIPGFLGRIKTMEGMDIYEAGSAKAAVRLAETHFHEAMEAQGYAEGDVLVQVLDVVKI